MNFLTPKQSCLPTNMTFLPLIQNTKDLLLQNEKLMWVQEKKVQILVAIHTSLPVAAEEATLLQAAGVSDPETTIIPGVTTSSSGEPGTTTGGITPQGPRTCIGALAPPPCQITPDFLHPLALPALPCNQLLGLGIQYQDRE